MKEKLIIENNPAKGKAKEITIKVINLFVKEGLSYKSACKILGKVQTNYHNLIPSREDRHNNPYFNAWLNGTDMSNENITKFIESIKK